MTDNKIPVIESRSLQRVDAYDKVLGKALYPGDLTPQNLLHAKVLFSGQPHARMRSIDLEAAKAVSGVVAIFTAADVPVNEYGLILPDQPVFVGLGSDKPDGDVSLWEGDQVAIIVAESETAASLARDLIQIEWEPLPIITDMETAMKDEVVLHPWHGSNILKKYQIRKGDMEAGWAAADVVVEGEYSLPYQEHAYLQPEAGLSYIDENGRITIEIGGQWT
ncbi:MAG: molybdopterin-dependent oxidoreductase, partial [Chloroflexi bacterium]|nr:molybdopterin-dependent oxidoreductase [Chloroflexota bacterium]